MLHSREGGGGASWLPSMQWSSPPSSRPGAGPPRPRRPVRYLVDAVREAYAGGYGTAHMLYGVLVAVGLAAPAVAVGTRVFRTAGA
ncbi:hypothetical protein GCM10027072_20620 [Streptomyces bullii]